MKVRNLEIRQIFSSTTEKTIEVTLETYKGTVTSSVPIGTSKGKHEAKYLPVDQVMNRFNLIRRYFTNEEFSNQEDVDTTLRLIDKTEDFRSIGANLALAISSAFLKAFALENFQQVFEYLCSIRKENAKMPRPICNVIGGGKHGGAVDIQEFQFIPIHQKSFLDSVTKIAGAYNLVAKKLNEADPNFFMAKNAESAWITNLKLEEILKLMGRTANEFLLKIGIDMAASSLWDGKQYYVYRYSNKVLSSSEQLTFIKELVRNYPIIYVEDPFNEDDFTSFGILTHELQNKMVCADDLYATNIKRLKDGLDFKASNAVLVKPNQVGTITDTIKFVDEAKKNKLITVMSHRSGETEDTLISHLATGLGCDYIKLGIGGERAIKINEMLRIEGKINR